MPRKPKMSGYPDQKVRLELAELDTLDLVDRHVLVVGGTDGLGRAIARAAAGRGASVTVVGRTFRDEGVPNLSFRKADLSSMAEAARVGTEVPADLDVVLFTTGIMAAPTRQVTDEGLERDAAVSYLSRVAVLRTLLPRLRPGARVFVMGFPGAGNLGDPADLDATGTYDAFAVHMNTVAGNEALVLDLVGRGVRAYGLNPGLVKTNIRGNYLGDGSLKHRLAELVIGWFTPSPERYAGTVVPLMFAPGLDAFNGVFFNQKGAAIERSDGMDDARVAAFTAAAEARVGRFA